MGNSKSGSRGKSYDKISKTLSVILGIVATLFLFLL